MRVLAHLSDLHFGRTDAKVVEALVADLHHVRPDLVVISGDLTQRARSHQFAEARAFLARLPAPAVVVPGNHDLAPFYRPLHRLFTPREKFHRHLPDHAPWPLWIDDEVVAIGLDSTRSLRWQSGKLHTRHLDHIDRVIAESPPAACKVAFLHHPPATHSTGHPFEAVAERGIDLALAGHVHKAHVELIHGGGGTTCVLVQASTACSTRLREDANGYGLIRIAMPRMEVVVRGWSGEAFHPVSFRGFVKDQRGWGAEESK
ncbi:MAG: metallophosphoesterase [Magnetospirillum sp.]|nr:metallophosphoesterase [Magnetospirillum sp.]